MNSLKFFGFLVGVLVVNLSHAALPKDDMKYILDFANNLCNSVPIEGRDGELTLDGKATAELDGLVSKLIDAGLDGAVVYKDNHYKNVLRKDLANTLKHSANCKKEVWDDLKKSILSEKKVETPESHLEQCLDRNNNGCLSLDEQLVIMDFAISKDVASNFSNKPNTAENRKNDFRLALEKSSAASGRKAVMSMVNSYRRSCGRITSNAHECVTKRRKAFRILDDTFALYKEIKRKL